MIRPSSAEPYRWLAEYYDDIFGPFRGPFDQARQMLLGGILPQVKTACDLACGTGTTALALAGIGIRTSAVDLSPHMCRLTRKKAKAAGLALRVTQADMRSFRLPEPVDLVTCEADAINHLARPADLKLVAQAVARALCPGGYFYFDVNNAAGFRRFWTANAWFERPGVCVAMRNGHNEAADRAWCDVDWFIRVGAFWRRRTERVEEVSWEQDEIERVLRAAGFDALQTWDSTPFFESNSMVGPGCRTHYLARKERT